MHPRHSLRALFAAVALLPSALPSVAQAQATSPQAYANDDGANLPQIRPSDLAYLERARTLVKANDIAAARLIFTRLANNGMAEAAFELGRTYDPDFLQTMHVAGLQPDPEVAYKWYIRAAGLGNAEAQSRLATLTLDARP
jgi:TPR repeat protein